MLFTTEKNTLKTNVFLVIWFVIYIVAAQRLQINTAQWFRVSSLHARQHCRTLPCVTAAALSAALCRSLPLSAGPCRTLPYLAVPCRTLRTLRALPHGSTAALCGRTLPCVTAAAPSASLCRSLPYLAVPCRTLRALPHAAARLHFSWVFIMPRFATLCRALPHSMRSVCSGRSERSAESPPISASLHSLRSLCGLHSALSRGAALMRSDILRCEENF